MPEARPMPDTRARVNEKTRPVRVRAKMLRREVCSG